MTTINRRLPDLLHGRTRALYTLALLPLLVSATNVPPAQASQPQTRVVSGQVLQVGSYTPITSVRAYVRGTRIGAVSTKHGRFILRDVPEGTTELVLRHPCYFPLQITIPASGQVSVSVGLPFDAAALARAGCGGAGARAADSASDSPVPLPQRD